jgi:chromosome segregation ATPase
MKIEQLKLENFKCFKTEKTFDFGKRFATIYNL